MTNWINGDFHVLIKGNFHELINGDFYLWTD